MDDEPLGALERARGQRQLPAVAGVQREHFPGTTARVADAPRTRIEQLREVRGDRPLPLPDPCSGQLAVLRGEALLHQCLEISRAATGPPDGSSTQNSSPPTRLTTAPGCADVALRSASAARIRIASPAA